MEFDRTLALDPDGDLRVDEQNQLVWIDGPEGVSQELRTALATVRGEDPIHPGFGLDVFTAAGSPLPIVRREIRRAVLEDDRVDSVEGIEVLERRDADRTLAVEVRVTLVDGTPLSIDAEI